MPTSEFIFIALLLASGIGFWFDSLRCREVATAICQQVCAQFHLQLLDDSIALYEIRLKRSQRGYFKIQRAYRFEFYDGGEQRLEGTLLMRGSTLEMLEVQGYMNRTFYPV
jgi:hypothetical protein